MDVNLTVSVFHSCALWGPDGAEPPGSCLLPLGNRFESELLYCDAGAFPARETAAHSHPAPHCLCVAMRFRRTAADDGERGGQLCAHGAEGSQLQLAAAGSPNAAKALRQSAAR